MFEEIKRDLSERHYLTGKPIVRLCYDHTPRALWRREDVTIQPVNSFYCKVCQALTETPEAR